MLKHTFSYQGQFTTGSNGGFEVLMHACKSVWSMRNHRGVKIMSPTKPFWGDSLKLSISLIQCITTQTVFTIYFPFNKIKGSV